MMWSNWAGKFFTAGDQERESEEKPVQIGQEERKMFDHLRPTPGRSSFRQSRIVSGRHGVIDSSSDDDDDADAYDDNAIPLGLNRTPPNRNSSRAEVLHDQENVWPDNTDSFSAMDLDLDHESAPSMCPTHSCYVPPSCDLLLRQVRGSTSTGTGAAATPPRVYAKWPHHAGVADIGHSRRIEEEKQQKQQKEQQRLIEQQELNYQKELSILRNEQRKRQESQQKEFEDGEKYRLQCEQYQQNLMSLGEKLGQDMSNLDQVREDIHKLRQKLQDVFYNQVDEQVKTFLKDKIEQTERGVAQRQAAITEVHDFFVSQHEAAGEGWLPVQKLTAFLSTDIMQELRTGKDHEVLFFDRIASTLTQIETLSNLSGTNALDRECTAFLQKHKIANYVAYMDCSKHKLFRDVISLDPSMEVKSLISVMAKVTPTLSSVVAAGTFGHMTAAVTQKVTQIEKQISDIHKIITEISESTIIEEVCDNLRESLEGEDAQLLRSLRSWDILFLHRVLQGLEQIRAKQPINEVDKEVVQFLREKNESLVHLFEPAAVKESETTPGVTESITGVGVDFLGPDLSAHSTAIESVIVNVPEEYQLPYRNCLEKCLELNEFLKSSKTAEKTKDGKDRRNERRNAICQSTIFLQKKLDEIPGKTRRCLLSHIFQLVIGLAATNDLLTIIELSIIPSSLCLGNIEKSRIFHDLVKKAAPVCVPQLNITSVYFDKPQRVRVVALYAAQVGFCIDLNTLIGLTTAGLENGLERVWNWLVSCGSALSYAAKNSNAESVETLCEICDTVKLFLDIAGSTLLNFLGARLKQFLIQPLRQVLSTRTESKARQLVSLLDQAGTRSQALPCLRDMYLLTPFSCFARVKKCEWENRAVEWQKVTVTLKKEFTDVKKTVGRAFNQLGTDAAGLLTFQENMGRLKQMPAMRNPDLRSKILFFLSDKALSICSDFKPGKGGVNEDEIVAPLATAFVWLLGSQKGMSDVFLAGLCSYCPFVFQLSLAVSEDDAVNKMELGYSKVELAPGNATSQEEQELAAKKWRRRMTSLLAFYASLIVRGHESERAGGPPLRHFTLQDAWLWLSRTVNFCARNKEDGLPTYILWILYTVINIISPSLMTSHQYRDHYVHLLKMVRAEILPHVHSPPREELEVLQFRINGLLS